MRITSLFLLALCLGSLCACGHAATDPVGTTAKSAAATTNGKVKVDATASQNQSSDDVVAQTSSNDDNAPPVAKAHPLWSTPLSSNDVQTYLSVMRAAAERVQHPTAADLAAQQRAKAQAATAESFSAQAQKASVAAETAQKAMMDAAQRGDFAKAKALAAQALPPPPIPASVSESPAEQAADMDWMSISGGSADEVIAEQRHIDTAHWSDIERAVEDAVPSPNTAYGEGDGGYTPTAQERKAEAESEALIAQNKKTLAPHVAEIHSLEITVRATHHSD